MQENQPKKPLYQIITFSLIAFIILTTFPIIMVDLYAQFNGKHKKSDPDQTDISYLLLATVASMNFIFTYIWGYLFDKNNWKPGKDSCFVK